MERERKIKRAKEREKNEGRLNAWNRLVVSWDIFTSRAVFWRARRASQNIRDE